MVVKLVSESYDLSNNPFMQERATVKDILLILGVGAIVIGSIVAPGLPKVIYYLTRKEKREKEKLARFDHGLFRQELQRLVKRGMVKFREVNGKTVVELTDKGNSKIVKYQIEDLKIARPKKWDSKWRLVIFDIPDKQRLARDILRDKLKELGFFRLQKSVFIYPFECRNEIKIVREALELSSREVLFLTVEKIENEKLFLQSFKL
jgi:CRISPR-associated endonuclease Cas2